MSDLSLNLNQDPDDYLDQAIEERLKAAHGRGIDTSDLAAQYGPDAVSTALTRLQNQKVTDFVRNQPGDTFNRDLIADVEMTVSLARENENEGLAYAAAMRKTYGPDVWDAALRVARKNQEQKLAATETKVAKAKANLAESKAYLNSVESRAAALIIDSLDMDIGSATSAFAPTGTYADALEAKISLTRLDRDIPIQLIRDGLEHADEGDHPAYTPDEINWSIDLITRSWDNALTGTDAALAYVARDLVDPISQSASSVPEPDHFDDLQMPPHGLVVIGQPVGYTQALTWSTISDKLVLTQWFPVDPKHRTVARLAPVPTVAVLPREAPRFLQNRATNDGEPFGWDSSEMGASRWFTAFAGWVHSVAETTEETEAPKRIRKRAARVGVPSTVTHVKLRKLEQAEWDPEAAEHSGREYTHRWIVSGHWRNQACGPARSRRRPTYIAPYVKGPPDKPLVAKDRIWAVDR